MSETASVTELLREFPRIRRAVLAGKRVVIRTKEGNMVLMAEKPPSDSLFGAMRGAISSAGLEATDSGAGDEDWAASL